MIPTSAIDPNGAIYQLLRYQRDIERLSEECVAENIPEILHVLLHSNCFLKSACVALGFDATMGGLSCVIEKNWAASNARFNKTEKVVESELQVMIENFIALTHAQIKTMQSAANHFNRLN